MKDSIIFVSIIIAVSVFFMLINDITVLKENINDYKIELLNIKTEINSLKDNQNTTIEMDLLFHKYMIECYRSIPRNNNTKIDWVMFSDIFEELYFNFDDASESFERFDNKITEYGKRKRINK